MLSILFLRKLELNFDSIELTGATLQRRQVDDFRFRTR